MPPPRRCPRARIGCTYRPPACEDPELVLGAFRRGEPETEPRVVGGAPNPAATAGSDLPLETSKDSLEQASRTRQEGVRVRGKLVVENSRPDDGHEVVDDRRHVGERALRVEAL